ncbi:unnamed protein product [Phyllotreta striolata]|uniref:Cytochrome P450 n=1 Tax=Phyllotreta striolata TaxID=444603 RepID=A0A9N9THQ1_PHYSR|nr:unnamed protein product [Phyllotreta striolata]
MLLTNNITTDVIIAISTIAIVIYLYVKHQYSYWKRLGVPQMKPTFPLGNYKFSFPKGLQMGAYTDLYYQEFKKIGAPFGGVYIGLTPHLVITDPDIAKAIFIKDFNYFTDRHMYSTKHQPISVNLITQKGDEWKAARAKLTSLFTTAKLRSFIEFATKCKLDLVAHVDELADGKQDVDIIKITTLYIADIITMVLFGFHAQNFKCENTDIISLGKGFFNSFSTAFQIQLLITHCFPKLAAFLRMGNVQKKIEEIGYTFIPKAVEYRIKNNIRGADLLQLIIDSTEPGKKLPMDEIVAQAFALLAAGLESSSSTSTVILYELAKHKEYQTKVREEIYRVKEKYEGKVTYDSVMELTYLQQILDESLRLYPLVTNLYRVCVQDYNIPGRDFLIKKDTPLIFPMVGFHRDPDQFPEPMKFDPSRFDNKNEKHGGFYPFGVGPRNCIGGKLGMIQSKLAVLAIIENYEVSLSPKTPDTLEIDDGAFLIQFKNVIYLKLKKIQK